MRDLPESQWLQKDQEAIRHLGPSVFWLPSVWFLFSGYLMVQTNYWGFRHCIQTLGNKKNRGEGKGEGALPLGILTQPSTYISIDNLTWIRVLYLRKRGRIEVVGELPSGSALPTMIRYYIPEDGELDIWYKRHCAQRIWGRGRDAAFPEVADLLNTQVQTIVTGWILTAKTSWC